MRRLLIALMTTALVIMPIQAAQAKTPYKVSAAASKSALTYGGRVTISGLVSPTAKRKTVYVQRFSAGRWSNIAKARTNSKSRYAVSFVPKLGPQVYRVYKASSKSKAAGSSRWIRITTSRWIPLKAITGGSDTSNVSYGSATIKGYEYKDSVRVRNDSVVVPLADRRCTQLDTHIGISSTEYPSTTGFAHIYKVTPSVITSFVSEYDLSADQSARHVRTALGANDLHMAGSASSTAPVVPSWVTYGSPMFYCAS